MQFNGWRTLLKGTSFVMCRFTEICNSCCEGKLIMYLDNVLAYNLVVYLLEMKRKLDSGGKEEKDSAGNRSLLPSLWDSYGPCMHLLCRRYNHPVDKICDRRTRRMLPCPTTWRLSLTAARSTIYVKMLAIKSRQMSNFHAICNLVSTVDKCFQMQISK